MCKNPSILPKSEWNQWKAKYKVDKYEEQSIYEQATHKEI